MIDIQRIVIRVSDDCKDWFKPVSGPDDCPKCGKNGLRWIYMFPGGE